LRLFFIQKRGQAIEPRSPELFVTVEPFECVPHWLGVETAGDGTPGFGAFDQAGFRQDVQMLHDRRQRHGKRRGKLGHRNIRLPGKPHYQRAPGRIGERGKGAVEGGV